MLEMTSALVNNGARVEKVGEEKAEPCAEDDEDC